MLSPTLLARLRAELLTDPEGRGYAGKTAQEQADLLNAPWTVTREPVAVDIAVSSVVGYLQLQGKLLPLLTYASAPPEDANPMAVGVAKNLMYAVDRPHAPADLSTSTPAALTALSGMLEILVSDPLSGLEQADAAALLALGQREQPPEEHHARVLDLTLNIPGAPNAFTADDVTEALA
jgi:hypothetical protein